MIAYVDSSVLLRFVLGEPGRLREWGRFERVVSSEILRLECLRTIDRARIRLALPEKAVAARRADLLARFEAFEFVKMDSNVLERAGEPFPTLVRSLDAIHIASALLVRRSLPALVFATHDQGQATAAQAEGFRVVGVSS